MKCIFVMRDGAENEGFIFAVREKHDKDCGGDPSVSPILDRFMVSKKGAISKYDPIEDEYKPFLYQD